MGKHSNAQGLRLITNKDWVSIFYSDSFNYSTLLGQNYVIQDYVLNFLIRLKMYVSKVRIKRTGPYVIVDIDSYNDYSTFVESFINRYCKKLKDQRSSSKYHCTTFDDASPINVDKLETKDPSNKESAKRAIFFKVKASNVLNYVKDNRLTGYSMRRLLSLNLSYLLKTKVIVRNKNIINKSPRLLDLLWNLSFKLKSPLPKHLNLKFCYLVYHSLQHTSALLLCRYLSVLLPRFCSKSRQNRKVIPFIHYFKKLIKLLFSYGFCSRAHIKGLKIVFKGRLNGSRRKSKYVILYGKTSVQSLKDRISYHQEDCYTIFGVSGIKVWIIH